MAASAAPRLRRFPALALPRAAPRPPRARSAAGFVPKRAPAIVTPRAEAGYRAVTWVGHSTVLLQLGGLNVLTDPIWSERASPLRWIGPRRLMTPGPHFRFVAADRRRAALTQSLRPSRCRDRAAHRRAFPRRRVALSDGARNLLRTFGVPRLVERDWWQSVNTPAFSATCAPAQHFSSRGMGDRKNTLWCSWVLAAAMRGSILAATRGFIPTSKRLGPAWVRLISSCCRSAPTSRAGSCGPCT